MASRPRIRLPRQWPKHIKSGILHAISLASVAVTAAQGRVARRQPYAPSSKLDTLYVPRRLTQGRMRLEAEIPAVESSTTRIRAGRTSICSGERA